MVTPPRSNRDKEERDRYLLVPTCDINRLKAARSPENKEMYLWRVCNNRYPQLRLSLAEIETLKTISQKERNKK